MLIITKIQAMTQIIYENFNKTTGPFIKIISNELAFLIAAEIFKII